MVKKLFICLCLAAFSAAPTFAEDTADGQTMCQLYTEKMLDVLAKYAWEWRTGFLESKFVWVGNSGNDQKFHSNKLYLQNGFGTWKKLHVACSYDKIAKKPKVTNLEDILKQ